jgi:hypothetical protein
MAPPMPPGYHPCSTTEFPPDLCFTLPLYYHHPPPAINPSARRADIITTFCHYNRLFNVLVTSSHRQSARSMLSFQALGQPVTTTILTDGRPPCNFLFSPVCHQESSRMVRRVLFNLGNAQGSFPASQLEHWIWSKLLNALSSRGRRAGGPCLCSYAFYSERLTITDVTEGQTTASQGFYLFKTWPI